MKMIETPKPRLPRWMKMQMPKGKEYSRVKNLIHDHKLNTICTSGKCPNKGECWNAGTATFMILGDRCTRNCRFCYVDLKSPLAIDWEEPKRLAKTIQLLKLKHCVITSVARDDIPDQGSMFWAVTIREIKMANPNTTIEVLIPDFDGQEKLIDKVINEQPEVISHNIETVKRLTPVIREKFSYATSLKTLKYIASSGLIAKSGLMLGLGETEAEVIQTMHDLKKHGVKVLTIGQYLQPSDRQVQVHEYINPEVFEHYRKIGLELGFSFVESGSLVRSSYRAERHVKA